MAQEINGKKGGGRQAAEQRISRSVLKMHRKARRRPQHQNKVEAKKYSTAISIKTRAMKPIKIPHQQTSSGICSQETIDV